MHTRSVLIKVDGAATTTIALENITGAETMASVLQAILVKLGWPVHPSRWRLRFQGHELSPDATLGSLSWDGTLELTLVEAYPSESLARGPGGIAPAPAAPPQCPPVPGSTSPSPEAPPPKPDQAKRRRARREYSAAPSAEYQASCDEDDEQLEDEEQLEAAWRSTKSKAGTSSRRATVRYYSRMNPERLYPLLVILSKDEIAKIKKEYVEQRASESFEVKEEIPIEVEPILPGCDCYPPRITSYLSSGEQTFVFRVAPRVIGKIEGAKVMVRQQHISLAEIDLEMKVARRTMVILSGLLTFFLPGISTLLKYFGLEFNPSSGINFYLALAEALFTWISPPVLAGVLGAITVLFWWTTRPQGKDVFWEIRTLPAIETPSTGPSPRKTPTTSRLASSAQSGVS